MAHGQHPACPAGKVNALIHRDEGHDNDLPAVRRESGAKCTCHGRPGRTRYPGHRAEPAIGLVKAGARSWTAIGVGRAHKASICISAKCMASSMLDAYQIICSS